MNNKNYLNVTFFYCTKQCTLHPKKGHGTDSDEFRLTTLEVGTHYDHWLRYNGSLRDLHRFCTGGFTVIPADFDGDRIENPDENKRGKGFIASNCIFLDNDGQTVENVKGRLAEVAINVNAYYNSTNDSPVLPKNRIIIALDEPITDLEIYKKVLSYLIDLTGTDKQCSDSLRLFYHGSGGSVFTNKPNSTSTHIKLAIQHDEAKNERIVIASERQREMLDYSALVALIDYAPELDDRHPWRRLVCDDEWLYHDDLYTIATSLILIDGGFEFLNDYISNQPYKESDRKRKLAWLSKLRSFNYSPRMFTKNNTPIEGIDGYSLYVLSKMLISNKEEGLLVEEKSHSINKNSENLIQSRNNNENSLHPRQGDGLVDSGTEKDGLIYSISRQKLIPEIAQTIPDKGFKDYERSISERSILPEQGNAETNAAYSTDTCLTNNQEHALSCTKTFLPSNRTNIDEDGNLYRKLDDSELEARLKTIKTAKSVDYDTLMEIELFERFVSGDRFEQNQHPTI